MIGAQHLMFILIGWLTLLFPQGSLESRMVFHQDIEIISPANDRQNSPAIVELNAELIQVVETSQAPGLQFLSQFYHVDHPNAYRYESKLLYLSIGEGIDLQLTPKTIIFPFHCFT